VTYHRYVLEKQGGVALAIGSRISALWLQHTGLKPQKLLITNTVLEENGKRNAVLQS